MIIKEGTDLGIRTVIKSKCSGHIFQGVKQFDTETNQAIIYILDQNSHSESGIKRYLTKYSLLPNPKVRSAEIENELAVCEVHLFGYRAYDKFTNEIIK